MTLSTEHPDLNQLAALSENTLPAPEREAVLLHLSTCDDCRTLLHTFAAATPEPAITPAPQPAAKPSRWTWRLPVFATAGLTAAAALILTLTHHQPPAPASAPQVAKLEPAPEPQPTPTTPAVPLKAAPRRTPAPIGPPPPTVTLDEPRHTAPPAKPAATTSFPDANTAVHMPQPAREAYAAKSAPAPAAAAAPSGTALARAAGLPATPPPAITGQDLSPEKDKSALPASVNESVTVSSEQTTVETVPTDSRTLNQATLTLKKSTTLPSGLPAASTLSLPEARLALDTAGALFRSSSTEPTTWQPVGRQWTGTARTLRRATPPTDALHAAAAKSAAAPASVIQLLTTDGHIFLSRDAGRTWHPAP